MHTSLRLTTIDATTRARSGQATPTISRRQREGGARSDSAAAPEQMGANRFDRNGRAWALPFTLRNQRAHILRSFVEVPLLGTHAPRAEALDPRAQVSFFVGNATGEWGC